MGPSAEDAPGHTFFALNEAAVTRGANGRIIDFSLSISDVPIADMRGDGLVVATATGSTAYALSVGGPLVAPGFNGLIAVPIAPHSLRARAMLTSENDVVEMDLSQNTAGREATLFIDGDMAKLPVAHQAHVRAPRRRADDTFALQGREFLRIRVLGVLLGAASLVERAETKLRVPRAIFCRKGGACFGIGTALEWFYCSSTPWRS